MKKLIFLSLMAICFCVRLYAQTNFKYKNASLPVEVRVQDLLSRMTLEEKNCSNAPYSCLFNHGEWKTE